MHRYLKKRIANGWVSSRVMADAIWANNTQQETQMFRHARLMGVSALLDLLQSKPPVPHEHKQTFGSICTHCGADEGCNDCHTSSCKTQLAFLKLDKPEFEHLWQMAYDGIPHEGHFPSYRHSTAYDMGMQCRGVPDRRAELRTAKLLSAQPVPA
jgi:hypothetical protein